MSAAGVSIAEWSAAGPETHKELQGLDFGDDDRTRALAEQLTISGRLDVQELTRGLRVRSTSFVGSVLLGSVRVTIIPKIDRLPLFRLLKYAYGFRNLTLYDQTHFETSDFPFQDLLLHQLEAEAQELISRGLKREYIGRKEHLSSPKGRFDFTELAMQGGVVSAQVPCRYHLRSEDCLSNQVLLAGIKSGVRLTSDLQLRARLRRKAAMLEERVSGLRLDRESIKRVERHSSRLSRAYDAAFEIVKVLLAGQGTSLSTDEDTIALPGFLFDMNRFFQRLLVRFFSDWLDGYRVEDERVIRGMIDYVPGHNPRNRRSPQPRPDIVIVKGRKTAAILDAKYRDLWETPLPRDMLYQLAIYALTGEADSESTILYPTMDATASEARLEIREPRGAFRANVVLRPVHMGRLAQLLMDRDTEHTRRHRREYARLLAFGDA